MIEGVRGKGRIEERRRMNQSSINHRSFLFFCLTIRSKSSSPETILREMSDLFTATTAAEVEEALARKHKLEATRPINYVIKTPLTSACERGKLEVVDCLLNHGADPNRTPRGSSWGPIHHAAQEGHAVIVECLVRAGANINDNHNEEGYPALKSGPGDAKFPCRLGNAPVMLLQNL